MMINTLLAAIVSDDRTIVNSLLQTDSGLATQVIDKAKLYQGPILHWMYAGDTALHLAAAGHRVEMTRLLLAAGANPNASRNHRRGSPMHYAADGQITEPTWNPEAQVQTMRILFDAGVDINAQDLNGATPLHRAVRTRSAAAVALLLSLGAAPALKNKSGSTPFHLVVQNTGHGGTGHPKAKDAQRQMIAAFLSLGIDVALKDGKGKSVLDCAKSDWIRDLLTKN